ncbi:Csu type fimbrial protein [Erwinia piriflorinigrans]|uniref:Protein U n=1 Tax=Erwinia piriflorinigrans CFBP 5888 TaxID=1161919 RepID=V5ZA98_9GAMM|nr:spore coat U domain-containing protein [Erwinia piriflorinigrans]CCG87956.1 Protein U [Erwinia piriflorinigrans CFBP 5888]
MRIHVISLLIAGSLVAGNAVAGSVTNPIAVQATVVPGCVLGNGTAGSDNFGTINFGNVTSLSTNVDVLTNIGTGSILLTCTPGIPVQIALDAGLNSVSTSTRLLKNGANVLSYQLYQDGGHTIVWGTGSDSYHFTSLPIPSNSNIFARLNSQGSFPVAGVYTDTVTATISW